MEATDLSSLLKVFRYIQIAAESASSPLPVDVRR